MGRRGLYVSFLLIFMMLALSLLVTGITQNGVYLDPRYSNAMFCNTTEVEIWINAENCQSGQINLTYDTNCADVTNWIRNTTNFPMGGWDSSTDGKEWITFLALSPLTGEYHVGTLTLHGVCEEACSTPLEFTSPSALFDPYGTEITVKWINGEFACSATPPPSPSPSPTPTPSPPPTENDVLFVPPHNEVSYSHTTEVEIWINAENCQSGQINLTYDTNCADVTNWIRNTTNFPMGRWDSSTDGKEWITFLALSPLTGEYHVGTLTLHGVCEEACSTPLEFTSPSALFDPYGTEITVRWINGTLNCTLAHDIFNTGPGTYPSISGTHNGTLTLDQTITVSKLYTYPCLGTGGHTEHIILWNNSGTIGEAHWNGYVGDWRNISFIPPVTLLAGNTYYYTIITSSYPQIINEQSFNATGGIITCTKFTDTNGVIYHDWIPAIRFE